MKKSIIAIAMLAASISTAESSQMQNSVFTKVTDHTKMVITQIPYQVEVCRQVTSSGDKTGDMLKGAILGGLIGNNVTKDLPDGGMAGAIIGGMLGHSNSDAQGGTSTQCNIETRYKEETKEVYSHSTVTFMDNGKQYTVRFQK